MVEMSATIDSAALDYVNGALNKMAGDFGEASRVMPKRIAVDICDSLKAKTKTAPKRARPSEYLIEKSKNSPPYISYKNGVRLPVMLHRWTLTRKRGTPAQYTRDYYAYAHVRHGKRGKIVQDLAAEKAEIRRLHIGISRAGLAKRSWNWIKRKILSHGTDSVWKRHKGERRNPQDAVNGEYRKDGIGATAIISNHLDYIQDALRPMAVDQSMKDAIAKRAYITAKAQNMTIEEAKQYARDLARSFIAA